MSVLYKKKSKVFDHVHNTYERSAHLSFFSDWATLTPIVILMWGDRHTSSTASLLLSQH